MHGCRVHKPPQINPTFSELSQLLPSLCVCMHSMRRLSLPVHTTLSIRVGRSPLGNPVSITPGIVENVDSADYFAAINNSTHSMV